MDTRNISEEEILELVETANFIGERPDGFIKLIHKQSGNVADGKGYYGFQGLSVRAISTNGVVDVTAQMITDSLGNPSGSLKLKFRKNRLGTNSSYVPLSKYNLEMLIKAEASDNGAHWTITDRTVKEQVAKEANKRRKARHEKEKKAFELAEEQVHAEMAKTIKALEGTYGEAYKDMKEYKDSILPKVEVEAKKIIQTL